MKPPRHITSGQWEQSTWNGEPDAMVINQVGSFVAECASVPNGLRSPEELANSKLIAQAKRMAELLYLHMQIFDHTHKMRGAVIGDWNWEQLGRDAKQVLLDAGWEEGE